MSETRVVRNLFRMHVDSYKCSGGTKGEGVPMVLGFEAKAVQSKTDRPITFYAGTLPCINSKLERFCASEKNRGEKVCALYKQVYFNDATLLYTRKVREAMRRELRLKNFRDSTRFHKEEEFYKHLVELQDAYIDFLHSTCLGMLLESGAACTTSRCSSSNPRSCWSTTTTTTPT